MNETKRFPHVQGMSPTTSKLIERLKGGKAGESITDEELASVAGRNCAVGSDGYQNLRTAILYVLKHNNVAWDRIRGAGSIQCLRAGERVDAARQDMGAIRRKAKRACRKLAVDLVEIPEVDRGNVLAMQAQLGTVAMFAQTTTTKALETRKVESAPEIGAIIRMFGAGS